MNSGKMFKNRSINDLWKSIIFLGGLVLIACSPISEVNTFKLEGENTTLYIHSPNFQFYFTNAEDSVNTKKDTISGFYLSGNSVVSTQLINADFTKNELEFLA